MCSSDGSIDVWLRITRAENPFLFKAVAELEVRPGIGLRNGFIKQLAEVGLMVHEKHALRTWRLHAYRGQTRASLGDHLSGAEAGAVASASATTGGPEDWPLSRGHLRRPPQPSMPPANLQSSLRRSSPVSR